MNEFDIEKTVANTFDRFILFHPHEAINGEIAIPHVWDKGNVPFLFVLGENGAGKSVFRRVFSMQAEDDGIKETMAVSMQLRSSGSAMTAFVFGDENWESTGSISANTIKSGITSCRKREHSHIVYWDEPDLGCSDATAAGIGLELVDFVRDLPPLTKGIVVTTHSRALVREVLTAGSLCSAFEPHYIYLGDGPSGQPAPATLEQWLDMPIIPERPVAVAERSHKRFRLIQNVMDAHKKNGSK